MTNSDIDATQQSDVMRKYGRGCLPHSVWSLAQYSCAELLIMTRLRFMVAAPDDVDSCVRHRLRGSCRREGHPARDRLEAKLCTFRPGEYVFWKVASSVSCSDEKIPDIDKAPRNGKWTGRIFGKITLNFPGSEERERCAFDRYPQPGRPYAQALYNSRADEPFEAGASEAGTGFLQDRGFAVAEVQWNWGKGRATSFTDSSGQKRFRRRRGIRHCPGYG